MPGDLDDDIAKLVAGGADPRRARVTDGRTFIDMTGFRWPHLIAAAMAGAMMLAGVVGIGMASTGRWVADAGDKAIIEGVQRSKADVLQLSAADIAARLAFSAEDGRVLVNLVASRRPELDRLLVWLRSLPSDDQPRAFAKLMEFASDVSSNGRMLLVRAIMTELSEADAATLTADIERIGQLLRTLAQKNDVERKWLISAGFPSVPRDQARAELWSHLNSAGRQRPELIVAIRDAALADPARLPAALSLLRDKTPIPACLSSAAVCPPCR